MHDDCIIFGDATNNEASRVKNSLKIYEIASGQQVNFDKSAIVFSKNTIRQVRDQVAGVLGDKEVERHDIYLGLPTIVGKSRKEVFDNI